MNSSQLKRAHSITLCGVRWRALLGLFVVTFCVCSDNEVLAAQQQDEFDTAVAVLAETIARQLSGKTVAVFEFPDLEGRVSNLSRIVSEQLTTELVQRLGSNGIVLERRQVIQVMAELRLQNTDLSATDVSRVGRQLGADAVLLGSTALVGEQIVVNARVVAVNGGQVLAAGRTSVHGSPQLLAMAREGIAAPNLTSTSRPSPRDTSRRSEPAPSPPQQAVTRPPTPAAQTVRTGNGTRFTLSPPECRRQRSEVVCRLSVTNHGDEAQYTFGTDWDTSEGTLIADEDGNVYRPSFARLGNSEKRERYTSNRHLMVKDLATRLVLHFEDVPSEVTSISLVQIEGQGILAGDNILARFRTVAIQP